MRGARVVPPASRFFGTLDHANIRIAGGLSARDGVAGGEALRVLEIGPGSPSLSEILREFWHYRELLYFLVWRDLKVRYKQTALGVLWALLQPLAAAGVFTVFFGRLARLPSDGMPYGLFVYAGLLPWNYFSSAVGAASNSLVSNQQLLTKVYFPRVLICIAAVTTPLVDLLVGLTALLPALPWFGVPLSMRMLGLPLFLLLSVLASLGPSLLLAALNVTYRDIRYTVPFLLQIGLFLTPVVYPSSIVPEAYRFLYSLNPMVAPVAGFRWALATGPWPGAELLIGFPVAAVFLIAGLAYFARVEGTFADRV